MRSFYPYFLIAATLCCGACEEDVVMVVGTERPFSLYGVLNPQRDTQFVHVFPIETTLQSTTKEPLKARFTTTDVSSGEKIVWSDSLLQDATGQYSHVFWTPFRVAYDHRYLLEMASEDGRTSTVEVVVPSQVKPLVEKPVVSYNIEAPVRIIGTIPRLLKPVIIFYGAAVKEVLPGGGFSYLLQEIPIPYGGDINRVDNGWLLSIDLKEAYRIVFEYLAARAPEPMIRQYGVQLLLITLDVIVANEEWNPPGGVFDPDALVVPEAMTNVENGFGFVGAGYRFRHQWRPEGEVLKAAGFQVPGS